MNNLTVYITYVILAPFAFTGMYTIVMFFDRIFKVRKGYVNAEYVNKAGRRKTKLIKPEDFKITIKDNDSDMIFKYNNHPGYLITSEKGVPTVCYDHNREQHNYFGEKNSTVDNHFVDQVGIMGINQGLASRNKNDILEDIKAWGPIVAAGAAVILCIFIAKQGNDTLTLLRTLANV